MSAPQDSLKSTFSIDFYALSDEICFQKQITGNIVKIANFKMAAIKNAENEKCEFPLNFTMTDKQNLPINVVVEKYNAISLYFLLII